MAGEEPLDGFTGGCQCGAVRYRLAQRPAHANVCHCRMCQKAGAAPFMAFATVPLAALVWTRGQPKTFVSSAIAERGFCAECGTPLTYRRFEAQECAVTIVSLDEPAAIAPTAQFGLPTKIAWLDDVPKLRAIDIGRWLDPAKLASRQHPDRDT